MRAPFNWVICLFHLVVLYNFHGNGRFLLTLRLKQSLDKSEFGWNSINQEIWTGRDLMPVSFTTLVQWGESRKGGQSLMISPRPIHQTFRQSHLVGVGELSWEHYREIWYKFTWLFTVLGKNGGFPSFTTLSFCLMMM